VKLKSKRRLAPVTLIPFLMIAMPSTVFAYVGPGAGLSIIGSLLAFVSAIVVGILGFLWFPIRRMMRKRKQARAAEQGAEEPSSNADEKIQDQTHTEDPKGDSSA
jgi:hypothetical protein